MGLAAPKVWRNPLLSEGRESRPYHNTTAGAACGITAVVCKPFAVSEVKAQHVDPEGRILGLSAIFPGKTTRILAVYALNNVQESRDFFVRHSQPFADWKPHFALGGFQQGLAGDRQVLRTT
jgi:hypothetical protein